MDRAGLKKACLPLACGRVFILLLFGFCLAGCALTVQGPHYRGAPIIKCFDYPGEIADLTENRFSAAVGKIGYWSPKRFLSETEANLYALEKYDPAKTPILFVHGAAGSPQDWRYFFSSIDRTRYQPWFFYYPSGLPVSAAADLLRQKLAGMQALYSPAKIHITAHSMGGLVVRSMLASYNDALPRIKLFISLSTPWGGEPLTEMGARLPAAVPSWEELRPQGPFLTTLFQKSLPPGVEYYLFFGHQGSRSLLRPNNDGTINLESLLRQEAQREAKGIYGFNENHVSILSSQAVLASYNALLRATDRATEAVAR